MAGVTDLATSLQCAHSGSKTPSSTAKLTLKGSSVLVAAELTGFPWDGMCQYTAPNGTKKPCESVTVVVPGTSSRLTVGGRPVLLTSVSAITDNLDAGLPSRLAITPASGHTTLTAL